MPTKLTKSQIERFRPDVVRFTFVTDLNVLLISWTFPLDIGEQHIAVPVELFRGAACELTAAQSRSALRLPRETSFMQYALCSG